MMMMMMGMVMMMIGMIMINHYRLR
jgi:hypothetical protein